MSDLYDLRPHVRTLLPNGLTILARRDSSVPVVAIVTHVKAGYFDETDDVVGIAHVLEHMYFKGTERRGVGRIAQDTKSHGGYLNAHTIYDHTCYYTVLPSSDFAEGLDIQADAFANSVIDAGELAKELEVIIQEAKRKADNPSALAVESMYELLYDRHRMRRWRIGREPGLRALTRDAVLNFYRTYYRPSNTILSVVGDVDPETVVQEAERQYGHLADHTIRRDRGPEEPPHSGFRYRELDGDIGEAELAIGWRTAPSSSADTPVLDLASLVLGAGRASRLYRAVRDRKLAASIGAGNYTPTDVGVFSVQAEMHADRSLEATCAAWDQIRMLREQPPEAAEVARAQRVFDARWLRRLETMEGEAMYLADWEALGGVEQAREYYDRVMSAQPRRISEIASAYLAPERAAMLIYRPATAPHVVANGDELFERLQQSTPTSLLFPSIELPKPSPDGRPIPRREEVVAQVEVYRTSNGIPVLVRRRPDAAMAYLGFYCPGGPVQETEETAGLTMLLARTMLKGTSTRSAEQLAAATELLGASLGTSVGQESFGWSLSVPVTNAEPALELLADVVQSASLSGSALETERAAALADLALLRDDMYRYPMRLAIATAFSGHPYGTPVMGTADSLGQVSSGSLREWHEKRVLSSAPVVIAVGDFDGQIVAAAVDRAFSVLQLAERWRTPEPAWPDHSAFAVEERDKAQTALLMAFPGPRRDEADRFPAALLASIASGLGGRFFEELRDRRSLAYTVHAFASEYQRAGLFGAYIATSPEQEETARDGLLGEFAKLRETPVTEEELTRAKRYTIGTHAIRQQSGAAVLAETLDAWLFGRGLSELEEFADRVQRVTSADILRLAQHHFDPDRRVEGIVRGKTRTV